MAIEVPQEASFDLRLGAQWSVRGAHGAIQFVIRELFDHRGAGPPVLPQQPQAVVTGPPGKGQRLASVEPGSRLDGASRRGRQRRPFRYRLRDAADDPVAGGGVEDDLTDRPAFSRTRGSPLLVGEPRNELDQRLVSIEEPSRHGAASCAHGRMIGEAGVDEAPAWSLDPVRIPDDLVGEVGVEPTRRFRGTGS